MELFSWVVCVLLAVAAVPAAVAVGSVVAADAGTLASHQAAERRQVPAVVLEDAEVVGGGTSSLRATAPARWTGPDGSDHEDVVPVPPGTPAGGTVLVWTAPDGSPSARPLEHRDVVVVTVTAGTLTLLLGLATAAAGHAAVCALVDRARDRTWEREWDEVEPLWAARFRLR
ncbi:hypothetical protein JD79_03265 [Geodermatophilus normandii]|uniref:Uncharacterized protein n=1 Tax=Geodermatophilus normandii TaxID=1137989 RepID=A0A317QMJ4_9ACTN|nr:hypothetical protein [Geodermatophilus normandii]PWW24087.1 hypothetical protein JD79_03265 [Geodermatophilus normandii]